MPKQSSRRFSSLTSITAWRRLAVHRVLFIGIAVVFGLGVIAYFGASPMATQDAETQRLRDETVVTVNGQAVTRGDYMSAWDQLERRAGGNELQAAYLQGMIVRSLVDEAMLRQVAEQRGLRVTDREVESALRAEREAGGSKENPLSDEDLLRLSGARNMDEVREAIRRRLLPERLGALLSGSDRLTMDDLLRTFDEVKVRHILIGVTTSPRPAPGALPDAQAKRRADEILARVRAGASFEQMANRFTTDPTNRPTRMDARTGREVPTGAPKGGDLGWYRRGGGFVKEFEDAAFALKPGEVSPVVKTPFGYHIIRVDEVRRNLPEDFEQTKQQQLEQLRQTRSGEALQKLMEEQRKNAQLVWKDPALEWRYAFAQSGGGMAMGMPAMPGGPDNKALLTKLRGAFTQNPSDTTAAFVLASLLYNEYVMAGVTPSPPSSDATAQQQRTSLRNEIIQAYERGLSGGEDREARFRLARLYKESKQPDKALQHYDLIGRLLRWDDSDRAQFDHQQLQEAYQQLGRPEKAAEHRKRAAEMAEAARKREAERVAAAAREEAERQQREREAREWRERNQQPAAQSPPGGGAAAPGGGAAAPGGGTAAPGGGAATPPAPARD
ncbi:MAG TPA: peptidylprolyl isomerase [Chthonomonadales bacterium]|nr:peptidylprolyl isomerase [Chthonomonadales bacterium]